MSYIKNYSIWRNLNESSSSDAVESIVSKLSEFGELKKGISGSEGVGLLQTALVDAGYLIAKGGPLNNGVDGDFGGNTEIALNKLIGKSKFTSSDSSDMQTKLIETGKDFSSTLNTWNSFVNLFNEARFGVKVHGEYADRYGLSIGITDKSAANYGGIGTLKTLQLPQSGPIGNISKSAWANLNVPTRGIANSQNGGVGCAAAVSIIFYRATGLPIIKGRVKNPIELGTAVLWEKFTKTDKSSWQIITDWENQWQPGDIILTSRGSKPGHVGIVVEGGKIISNSSSGFEGDTSGQIELNYAMKSGQSGVFGKALKTWKEGVAYKNPTQTACFRYLGQYLTQWAGALPSMTPTGQPDNVDIQMNTPTPTIVVPQPEESAQGTTSTTKEVTPIEIAPIKPSEIVPSEEGKIDLIQIANKNNSKI
jgi:hypothetical protein